MQTDTAWAQIRKPAVFFLIVSIHAAIVLFALRSMTRQHIRSDEPLVFLALREPERAAEQRPSLPSAKERPAPRAGHQITIPPPPPQQQAAADQASSAVDWNSEAEMAAKQQAQLAMSPKPRALDQHGAGADMNGGLGPDHGGKPEFGWDRSHTHRVEGIDGGGILIHVNERCALVVFPLPFIGCGIGKIPVRSDLFDHMHDVTESDANSKNISP